MITENQLTERMDKLKKDLDFYEKEEERLEREILANSRDIARVKGGINEIEVLRTMIPKSL